MTNLVAELSYVRVYAQRETFSHFKLIKGDRDHAAWVHATRYQAL